MIFNGVSTTGASPNAIQIGSGTITSTGYLSSASSYLSTTTGGSASRTDCFIAEDTGNPAYLRYGQATLFNISGNTWVFSCVQSFGGTVGSSWGNGSLALSGVLDRVRLTTAAGTAQFDAGSVNILYE